MGDVRRGGGRIYSRRDLESVVPNQQEVVDQQLCAARGGMVAGIFGALLLGLSRSRVGRRAGRIRRWSSAAIRSSLTCFLNCLLRWSGSPLARRGIRQALERSQTPGWRACIRRLRSRRCSIRYYSSRSASCRCCSFIAGKSSSRYRVELRAECPFIRLVCSRR